MTLEVARLLTELSCEIRRQIGILVGRRGSIDFVIVGDQKGITIPDLSRERTGILRLRGLRLLHTHLQGEPLTEEDFTDLALLRLDMIVALSVNEDGLPGSVHSGHLLPGNREKKVWEVVPSSSMTPVLEIDFLRWIQSLEDEFQKGQRAITLRGAGERAILLSVGKESREALENSMQELKTLAVSSGLDVAETIIQKPQNISPATLLGEGKLKELLIKCMQSGVDLIVFDQNLTPRQIATISDRTELRVLDRTQLILDIFAQRAHTQDGKLQVELAQLKYLLPRLSEKTLAFSRLTGGIGGRGPGETKLEIDRRRVRERIHLLEKELVRLSRRREQRRARRTRAEIPVISIIGYTNAGKTTLFNLLTGSRFDAEDKLFATLDTATRKWRSMGNLEVVITDTVGFIKNLPKDLLGAFRATFDELQESHLLLHLVDLSHPLYGEQIEAVEKILRELALDLIPTVLVLNKKDRLPEDEVEALCRKHQAIAISARQPESLGNLYVLLEKKLRENGRSSTGPVDGGGDFDILSYNPLRAREDHGSYL